MGGQAARDPAQHCPGRLRLPEALTEACAWAAQTGQADVANKPTCQSPPHNSGLFSQRTYCTRACGAAAPSVAGRGPDRPHGSARARGWDLGSLGRSCLPSGMSEGRQETAFLVQPSSAAPLPSHACTRRADGETEAGRGLGCNGAHGAPATPPRKLLPAPPAPGRSGAHWLLLPVVFISHSPLFQELPNVILSSFPPPHRPPLLCLPPGGALAMKGLFLLPRGTLTFPWLPGQSRQGSRPGWEPGNCCPC